MPDAPRNGNYICSLCSTEVETTPDHRPLAMIKASSGEPNVRVIILDGKELHACLFEPTRPTA
jgi:hypothetical protein